MWIWQLLTVYLEDTWSPLATDQSGSRVTRSSQAVAIGITGNPQLASSSVLVAVIHSDFVRLSESVGNIPSSWG